MAKRLSARAVTCRSAPSPRPSSTPRSLRRARAPSSRSAFISLFDQLVGAIGARGRDESPRLIADGDTGQG